MLTGGWNSGSGRDAEQAAPGHQLSEDDAVLTPIFHSLAHSARRRQPARATAPDAAAQQATVPDAAAQQVVPPYATATQAFAPYADATHGDCSHRVAAPPRSWPDRLADPVTEFELDPLHAPIPPQKLAGPPPVRALRSISGGRHRR